MSAVVALQIDASDAQAAIRRVQDVRGKLRDRRGLHAEIAGEAERLTRGYLRRLNRHKTATRLGARPTGHLEAAARSIESESDSTAARVLIPRATGLYRAFANFIIRPGAGKVYLTIPAHKRSYGKRAGEFGDRLAFTMLIESQQPVLVFTDSGEVAYWLRRQVTIEQDRTLLPSAKGYGKAMRGATDRYIRRILRPRKGGTA